MHTKVWGSLIQALETVAIHWEAGGGNFHTLKEVMRTGLPSLEFPNFFGPPSTHWSFKDRKMWFQVLHIYYALLA